MAADCHLHSFSIAGRHFSQRDPDGELDRSPNEEDERAVRLSEVLGEVGAGGVYTYDFGDNWEHALEVEREFDHEVGRLDVSFVDGERRCPPEDCGGVGGYEELLRSLRSPKASRSRELIKWAGGPFDAEEFSISDAEKASRLGRESDLPDR